MNTKITITLEAECEDMLTAETIASILTQKGRDGVNQDKVKVGLADVEIQHMQIKNIQSL